MSSSRALKLKRIPGGKNYLRPATANIFIAGVGAVGGALIKQFNKLDHLKYDLKVIGFCNSSKVKWRDGTISADELYGGKPKLWDDIIAKLQRFQSENSPVIFVDATGSPEVAALYLELLECGIHVVTPSKLANTTDQSYYNSLKQASEFHKARYFYETTVGAGLPVIQTLSNLIESGDKILEVSGVLSGTMTYLFQELERGARFSKAVLQARTLGYAEPDPRDDLSGEDVARKFLIIARTCGLEIERSEIEVESLIPDELSDVDPNSFMSLFADYDQQWQDRINSELKSGNTLRYTGTFKDNKIVIGIESVRKESNLGRLFGTNNLIQIKTERYFDQPLVIQGPGAGKEVTAAGVLADIQKVMRG
jgi:bifunctional aspartokinase / homoserine dehydrogenase 1